MTYEKLLSYAFRLLSIRGRSTKELKDKLSSRCEDENIVNQVLEYLQKNKFLNDYDFALSFAKSRLNKAKGPQIIKFELKRKGISQEDIVKVISEILTDQNTEAAIAKRFLERKNSWRNLSPFEFKKKAYAALRNRGFSHETIRSVIDDRDLSE